MRHKIPGIDVSKWQREIDWPAVAEHKSFAYLKASEGVLYTDPTFRRNWREANAAGMVVGCYHFARISKSPTLVLDAEKEADWFTYVMENTEIPDDGYASGSLPPALDVEWDKRAKGIPVEGVKQWCHAFLERLEKNTGRRPIIYTGYSFWRYKLARSIEFRQYPLWLARYNAGSTPSKEPEGWPATIWQHTGRGRCPGVKGNCDLNWFFGTAEDFQKFRGVEQEKPEPVIDPATASLYQEIMAWLGTWLARAPEK